MWDRKHDDDDEEDGDNEKKKDKRSGGVDIDSSDVDVGGDLVGRDKIVQLPPPKQEDIQSKITNSIWNAIGLVGGGVFLFLTAGAGWVALGLFLSISTKDSLGRSAILPEIAAVGLCVTILCCIFFAVLGISLRNIYKKTR